MNSRIRDHRIVKYFEIYCHGCKQWLDLGDINPKENKVHCNLCDTHLGFLHDIPKEFRDLISW